MDMPRLIEAPAMIPAAGDPSKRIEEFAGRASTGDETISIARMVSPTDWTEPGQRPDFDEYTLVLRGTLHVETGSGAFLVRAGQAFATERGTWVRYSTPGEATTEYIAICATAFSTASVHRDGG